MWRQHGVRGVNMPHNACCQPGFALGACCAPQCVWGDGASEGGSLGQDVGVVDLGCREQGRLAQTRGDLLDIGIAQRDSVE